MLRNIFGGEAVGDGRVPDGVDRGAGTKFLITKFLITKFLITKFLIIKNS
jgi:hypothetical protein